MRKPAFCICENKDADQLHSSRKADQRLCFHYTDSTIPLLPKSEISSFIPFFLAVQLDLCQNWLEIQKPGFLITQLILDHAADKRNQVSRCRWNCGGRMCFIGALHFFLK